MRYKILFTLGLSAVWLLIFSLLNIPTPIFPLWFVFLPFIAIGGLLSISMVILIMFIITYIITGKEDYDEGFWNE